MTISVEKAKQMSFVWEAIVILIGWFFFWPAALIANVWVYLHAHNLEKASGTTIRGVGFLKWELIVIVALFVLAVVILAVLVILGPVISGTFQNMPH